MTAFEIASHTEHGTATPFPVTEKESCKSSQQVKDLYGKSGSPSGTPSSSVSNSPVTIQTSNHQPEITINNTALRGDLFAVKGSGQATVGNSNKNEQETSQMRARQMASLATLAGGIAHHFNNIVCGMSTMTEMALETDDHSTMRRALQMSAEAASRICYLTQTLLACGCQQGGEPDLADLTEELLTMVAATEQRLNNKGIELVLDLRATRVAAIPKKRFALVLEHLMRNAEEALDEVDSCMVGASPKRIAITTQSQGGQILLEVTDNGTGIAPEHLAQVFDPFFTTKGVQGGGNRNNAGLGLTLALGMALDLGGHIWADSSPGHQTTIHMLLPVVG